MSDKDVVLRILHYVPDATFEFENDNCIYAKLNNKKNIFYGCIRTCKQKNEILLLLRKLENLKFLDLRKNRICSMPDMCFKNLIHLDLASNYLTEVPAWVKHNNIEFLNLGVNNLKLIPDWISKFSNLKVVKLHKNKLFDVSSISACTNIQVLNLYLNKMREIPSFIWKFKKMQFFSWGLTNIDFLSNEISNWKNLQWLSLVANKITVLPDEICELKQLKGMRLNKNKIEKLPSNIGQLQNLQELSLHKNCLKELPESFQKLNLKKLNLSYNMFETIPPGINSDWFCFDNKDCKWKH
jgi:Leucine-rich repeat (LRR) protein